MLRASRFSYLARAAVVVALAAALGLLAAGPVRATESAALRCNFGTVPEPGEVVTNPVFLSVAFSCFRNDTLVIPPPDSTLFLDGAPIPFNRAGEFGTEVLFTNVTLPLGPHTAKVVVAGDGEFTWSFTVVGPGDLPKAGDAAQTLPVLLALLAGVLLLTGGLTLRARRAAGR
ncbi:MAG: LPXTG cell wall anchor domain-containing protein [Chloroflexi bacterium]|nr:LPXTG cell wall anchor domain-containing protein [Chloroflexota bacterium]